MGLPVRDASSNVSVRPALANAVRFLHPRSIRRLLVPVVAVAIVFFSGLVVALNATLPLDSSLRSVARFNVAKLRYSMQGTGPSRDAWLWRDASLFSASPGHPLNESAPGGDVGIIIKTSYGSRARLPAQVEALGLGRRERSVMENAKSFGRDRSKRIQDVFVPDDDRFIAVADFAPADQERYQGIRILDAMGAVMDKLSPRLWNHPRFINYGGMAAAVQDGYHKMASRFSAAYGWEFEAAKFLISLELAWKHMPDRKWYVLISDNTFLVETSLRLLLNRLDHTRPLYIGKPVGDYKGRFAHASGAIILSNEAVRRVMSPEAAGIVNSAHQRSLDHMFGDKLLGQTLQKLGVYLEEDYAHLFNGEQARNSRIRPDRFCAPLISFYGLSAADTDDMRSVGMTLHGSAHVVRWADLWHLFGLPSMSAMQPGLARAGRDHIGIRDHGSESRNAQSAAACWQVCREQGARQCVAWTWEPQTSTCHTAPWFRIGTKAQGLQSGLNALGVQELWDQCR